MKKKIYIFFFTEFQKNDPVKNFLFPAPGFTNGKKRIMKFQAKLFFPPVSQKKEEIKEFRQIILSKLFSPPVLQMKKEGTSKDHKKIFFPT